MSEERIDELEQRGLSRSQATELLAQVSGQGDALKLLAAGFPYALAGLIADDITDAYFVRKPARAAFLISMGIDHEFAEAVAETINATIPPTRAGASA